MQIRLRMIGELAAFLPAGGQFDQVALECAKETRLDHFIASLNLPDELDYIVLRNNDLIDEATRAAVTLVENDEVVLFAPLKGG